jgi:hypothetical protein
MFAAILRIEQLSRVSRTSLCNRDNADRWGFHHRIDLVVAAKSKAGFGVEKANNG